MSLLKLTPGVFVTSHHVDGLEVSCEVDQVPHLVKRSAPGALKAGDEGRGRVKRDYKNAAMVCELEATLDYLKRHGERLNLEGERATSWQWRQGDAAEIVRLLPGVQRRLQAFALKTNDWLLFIRPWKSVGPRFSFQVRADYLLEVGAAEAYRSIVEHWTENICPLLVGIPNDSPPVWRISRVDLAADLAGVELEANDLALFTTRARQRNERHASHDATGRHVGRRFTGFEFGRRGAPFYARIYDKTLQAAPGAPVREVWERNGYKPEVHGETVWRLEFELRSQLLREMVREDGSRLSDDPAQTIGEDLDALWRDGVVKRLVLKERTGDARIERKPVRDWWEQLVSLGNHMPLSGQTGTPFKRRPPVLTDPNQFLATALRALATAGLRVCPGFG